MSNPTSPAPLHTAAADHIHVQDGDWNRWDGSICPEQFACTTYPRSYDVAYKQAPGHSPEHPVFRITGSQLLINPADDVSRGMLDARATLSFADAIIADMDNPNMAVLKMIADAQDRLRYAMAASGPLLYPNRQPYTHRDQPASATSSTQED